MGTMTVKERWQGVSGQVSRAARRACMTDWSGPLTRSLIMVDNLEPRSGDELFCRAARVPCGRHPAAASGGA